MSQEAYVILTDYDETQMVVLPLRGFSQLDVEDAIRELDQEGEILVKDSLAAEGVTVHNLKESLIDIFGIEEE